MGNLRIADCHEVWQVAPALPHLVDRLICYFFFKKTIDMTIICILVTSGLSGGTDCETDKEISHITTRTAKLLSGLYIVPQILKKRDGVIETKSVVGWYNK